METFVEKIYVEELITQCTWAIAAVARMNDILESNEQGRPQLFFRQAVELLQHSALASKLLWPPGGTIAFKNKRAKARGQHLRGVLQMPERHVLKSRSLRDHFEHYDERLDDWVANSPNRIFVDDVIGPRAWIGGVQDHEIFKLYDPQTKTLLFRGEPFDIQALVDGLSDVQKRAQTRTNALTGAKKMMLAPHSIGALTSDCQVRFKYPDGGLDRMGKNGVRSCKDTSDFYQKSR